jgi:uncharacterized protein GlcG (DUF336 family)
MPLTLEHAKSLAAAALTRAGTRKMAVSVAVIDTSFHLKAAGRADDAGPATIDIAYGKARAALSFGCSSRQIAEALAINPQAGPSVLASLPGPIILLPGGILIQDETGAVIGALGVAGGAPDDDELVATGGIGV